MKIKSLYIHIPFCLRKCNYCDFVSYAESGFSQLRADYPSLLIEELALYRQQGADLSHLQTIYFGGGTPSLLSAAEITLILESLPAAAEITLEANPETLSPDSLQGYLSAGVYCLGAKGGF
jgi:oxygen-independent coproporphyrinogen-3 oxidase